MSELEDAADRYRRERERAAEALDVLRRKLGLLGASLQAKLSEKAVDLGDFRGPELPSFLKVELPGPSGFNSIWRIQISDKGACCFARGREVPIADWLADLREQMERQAEDLAARTQQLAGSLGDLSAGDDGTEDEDLLLGPRSRPSALAAART